MNENLNGQTKEELLLKIKNQKLLIDELLAEKEAEAKLDYPWKGNLGHWYWNIQSNDVVFNPMKVEAIGYTIEELPDKIPYSFFTDKLHPDDYERVMENMSQHLEGSTRYMKWSIVSKRKMVPGSGFMIVEKLRKDQKMERHFFLLVSFLMFQNRKAKWKISKI